MTTLDTTPFGEMMTQSTPVGKEVPVGNAVTHREIATNSYAIVGSVPSGLPEDLADGPERYVFRVGGEHPAESVTITINTKRLIERAKIRKLNQAMRRARRR